MVAELLVRRQATTRRRRRWSISPKPAFKLGVAALKVGLAAHELQVSVTADKPQYAVRQTALAQHQGRRSGGKPVAGRARSRSPRSTKACSRCATTTRWNLLDAMIRERAWGVETSTAQSEIIGRRHYGRKAVAAGRRRRPRRRRASCSTRCCCGRRSVVLDANGEATIEVPLNDSLTSFRLVAVADAGAQRVRHRQRQHPRHAGPAGARRACRRWCATATSSARC